VIRDWFGIDIELMNADTETNIDTARTRAERLIQTARIAWWDHSTRGGRRNRAGLREHGILSSSISRRTQITEQGYKFVFRNFPCSELVKNGLSLIDDLSAPLRPHRAQRCLCM
jgi:branched-chain amino acid transport system substrate-binding protein